MTFTDAVSGTLASVSSAAKRGGKQLRCNGSNEHDHLAGAVQDDRHLITASGLEYDHSQRGTNAMLASSTSS